VNVIMDGLSAGPGRPSAPWYIPGTTTRSQGTPAARRRSAYSTSSAWNRSRSPTPTQAGGSADRPVRRAAAAYSGSAAGTGTGDSADPGRDGRSPRW
jgi:hypothetical protein